MNIITREHLEFVPAELTDKYNDPNCSKYIFVFSRKKGNKIYKTKRFSIGFITKHPTLKEYAFYPVGAIALSYQSMSIISSVLLKLEKGTIKYNYKKGEFKHENELCNGNANSK